MARQIITTLDAPRASLFSQGVRVDSTPGTLVSITLTAHVVD
ncbi:hypothetical protein ACH3VR_22865 [Microbacterium sp. B2969]|uniref:Uncharacterized protein n=1 Tax=Microbacterium alkaliflavum TaxID=3248839 RepID=A0ABW7QE88_9MICO